MLISEVIEDIRLKLLDRDRINFLDNSELLVYFNEGHRQLRRLVTNYKPSLIAVTEKKFTSSGIEISSLDNIPIKILNVKLGKEIIAPVLEDDVEEDCIGKPEGYWQNGFKEIRWYPIPNDTYLYSVKYVPETIKLVETDTFPWPLDFSDVIFEYVHIRAKLRDEYSVEDEKQILAIMNDQVQQLLTGLTPEHTMVEGYFPVPAIRIGDY